MKISYFQVLIEPSKLLKKILGQSNLNLKNTEKLIGKKIPVEKDHPFHTDNLVAQKRDSNNKAFTPRPRVQGKDNAGSKKPNNKSNFTRNR